MHSNSFSLALLLFCRCKCGNCDVLLLQNISECYCCSELEGCMESIKTEPFHLYPVDPSFSPFLRFWSCIAVKWNQMHGNIPLLVLAVTTIGSDAPGRHNFFFARVLHDKSTHYLHSIRAKMKEMVPESTSRHVTRPMPRLTRY